MGIMKTTVTVIVITLLGSGMLSSCSNKGPGGPNSTVPAPTLEVDPGLTPRLATVAGIDGGPDRPVGSIAGPTGGQADLVLGELNVLTDDRAKVEALAARWRGTIVKEVSFDAIGTPVAQRLYLVRLDPSAADPSRLGTSLQAIDPGARGAHRASSVEVQRLLAVAVQERLADPSLTLGVNFLFEPQGIWEGSTLDGSGSNAFQWDYMRRHQVPQAWQALQAAGKLGNKVKILIMDGGFVPTADYPASTTLYPGNGWKQPNPATCGGSPCPWHATDVVSAAMGQVDNGFGAAGPAGPVAELIAVQSPSPDLFKYIEYLFAVLGGLSNGPRVINISATAKIPGIIGFLVKPLDWISTIVRGRDPVLGIRLGQGSLLFAAAGNTGEDVDHEGCFVFCWESDVFVPCELDNAVCIGGLGSGTSSLDTPRHPSSCYGKQQRAHYRDFDSPGKQDNSVDFFGPFTLFVGPQPDSMGNVSGTDARSNSGTSFASPFSAGMAALVWAADPTLNADEVFAILLETADSTSDYGLAINAYAAVKKALQRGANNPPQIRIVKPASGASFAVSIQGVDFEAQVKDFEDGNGCCQVTWSSSLEGGIGAGTQLNHQFQMLGTHVITATVQDANGAASQASITVTLTDPGPSVSILKPGSSDAIHRGFSTGLLGRARDELVDLRVSPTPSSWVTWTSDHADDTALFPLHGCGTAVTFPSNGTRTLTFSARNQYGTTNRAQVTINVVDPPPGPSVEIRQPAPNGSANVGDVVTLAAYSAGGQQPLSYRWAWKANDPNCAEVTLTVTPWPFAPVNPDPNAPNLYADWDTAGATSVPSGCGYRDGQIRLYVADALQLTDSDAQSFTLMVPPR